MFWISAAGCLAHLVGASDDPHQAFTRPTILIASDISPMDLLAIRQPNLMGIVLARGGKHVSHGDIGKVPGNSHGHRRR